MTRDSSKTQPQWHDIQKHDSTKLGADPKGLIRVLPTRGARRRRRASGCRLTPRMTPLRRLRTTPRKLNHISVLAVTRRETRRSYEVSWPVKLASQPQHLSSGRPAAGGGPRHQSTSVERDSGPDLEAGFAMAPSILRDFLTTIAWWWDGGTATSCRCMEVMACPPLSVPTLDPRSYRMGPRQGKKRLNQSDELSRVRGRGSRG
jgi:hypothetical protein